MLGRGLFQGEHFSSMKERSNFHVNFLRQVVADHLIKESGVRPLLHCYAVEALVDDGVMKVYPSILHWFTNFKRLTFVRRTPFCSKIGHSFLYCFKSRARGMAYKALT